MDPDAEEGMARNDSTISLHGFTERVKFQAAWLGQSEKLEQQKERLLQEQRRLQDEQEALVEKLEVVNCQFNSGIMNDLAEGVDKTVLSCPPTHWLAPGRDWFQRRAPLLLLRTRLTPRVRTSRWRLSLSTRSDANNLWAPAPSGHKKIYRSFTELVLREFLLWQIICR